MTLAFVLSGGANLGAMQVGALEVLLRRGFQPEILVGVSAGAFNATWMAYNPSRAGVRRLGQIWREITPQYFKIPRATQIVRRLVRNEDGIFPIDDRYRFTLNWTTPESTFKEITNPRLYLVASKLVDGSSRVFGDLAEDRIIDGIMASTALPLIYPPWQVDGESYVDGGMYSDLPLQLAIERGADQIIALHIRHPSDHRIQPVPHGIFSIGRHCLATLIDRTGDYEIQIVSQMKHIKLHRINLWPEKEPGTWDFRHAADLIATGRRQAIESLLSDPF